MNKLVPRSKMVRKSRTLAELGIIPTDYSIKVRVKEFQVATKTGTLITRGPCVSLQQFNPDGHFLAAISFNLEETESFLTGLSTCLRALGLYRFRKNLERLTRPKKTNQGGENG